MSDPLQPFADIVNMVADKDRKIHALQATVGERDDEIKRLQATFTGEQSQPALEMIRAKCEQYWNEPGPLCAAEWHSILEFIHKLTWTAEAERAVTPPGKE